MHNKKVLLRLFKGLLNIKTMCNKNSIKKTKYIGIRVEEELNDFLQGLAEVLGMSVSDVCRDAIEKQYFGEDSKND